MRRPAIVTVMSAALAVTPLGAGAATATAPPDDAPADTEPEDTEPADTERAGVSTNFERQLAELAFADLLVLDLDVEPAGYACSEPESLEEGSPITCFAIDGDGNLIIAETTVSGGTGRFEFEVSATDTAPPTPPTEPDLTRSTEADGMVLAHGDLINEHADDFVRAYLLDDQIAGIAVYEFDPIDMMLTLDITRAPGVAFSVEDLAWGNTTGLAGQHWAADQPFRTPGASLQPGFTIVVDGVRYVSDFALMVRVADNTIPRNAWVTIAERPSEEQEEDEDEPLPG